MRAFLTRPLTGRDAAVLLGVLGWIAAAGGTGGGYWYGRMQAQEAEASAAAAQAQADDLDAKVRTAEAERLQAQHQARVLSRRLDQALAPWPYGPEIEQSLVQQLERSPQGRVVIDYCAAEAPRSQDFADRLVQSLRRAGFTARSRPQPSNSPELDALYGLQIINKGPRSLEVARGLVRSLEAIGMPVTTDRDAEPAGDDEIVIRIGRRPYERVPRPTSQSARLL